MRQVFLKGFLWFIVCAGLIFTFMGFGFCMADGLVGDAFAYLFLLIPVIFAAIPLYRMRKAQEPGKASGDYKRKLRQWEAEGYDVSELRRKWFSDREGSK
jgi:hypothetical protein